MRGNTHRPRFSSEGSGRCRRNGLGYNRETGKQEGRKGETDSAEKRRRERLEARAANWAPGSMKSERTMSGLFLEWEKGKEKLLGNVGTHLLV